jgi:hypothetical protein
LDVDDAAPECWELERESYGEEEQSLVRVEEEGDMAQDEQPCGNAALKDEKELVGTL